MTKKRKMQKNKRQRNSQIHITKSVIGYFAFDDSGELVYYDLFEPNPSKVADLLNKPIPSNFLELVGQAEEDDFAADVIRSRLRDYALSFGFVKNENEFNKFLSELGIILSRKASEKSITKDKLVIQASNALQDLEKHSNIFIERLREWYGLHYPEFKEKKHERYAETIEKYGSREKMPGFSGSIGLRINKADEEIIREFSSLTRNTFKMKKDLETYVKITMRRVAPNFSSLIDPLLAAQLLALAGSLEKIAKMPSSTIQLLGAERALFRHLRNKKHIKPPKFGLLYLDKRIQNAPKHKKGRVARVLAAKLMLAARIDFYSGRDDSDKLKQELKYEIKKVLEES